MLRRNVNPWGTFLCKIIFLFLIIYVQFASNEVLCVVKCFLASFAKGMVLKQILHLLSLSTNDKSFWVI